MVVERGSGINFLDSVREYRRVNEILRLLKVGSDFARVFIAKTTGAELPGPPFGGVHIIARSRYADGDRYGAAPGAGGEPAATSVATGGVKSPLVRGAVIYLAPSVFP